MKNKILIVDDNEYLVEILKADLELLNYEVLTAMDGEEALQKVYKYQPDLIILDIMMPKINGFQVCRKIKSDPKYKDTIVIMLTAKVALDDKYWGLDCGADEYITKPFDTDELEKIIKEKLANKDKEKNLHPITKLPLFGNFNEEKIKRYKEGLKLSAISFYYRDSCLEELELVNGKFWVLDVLAYTASLLKEFIKDIAKYDPYLSFAGDNTFWLLINADKEKAVEITKKCLAYLNNNLSSFKRADENTSESIINERTVPILMMGCKIEIYNPSKKNIEERKSTIAR